jgi:hypothetical protein
MIEIDDENLIFIIKKILDDEILFKKLRKDFADIVGDLVNFKYNPNCSCKEKVKKYFQEKLKENKNTLDYYLPSMKFRKINNPDNLSGRIFTIPKKSWENFSKSLEKKYFKSFSIIEKNNIEMEIYFI